MKFPADAIRVDLARGSVIVLMLYLPIMAGLCAASVYAVVDASEPAVMVIGSGFGVLFFGLFILVLVGIPRLVESRGLVFDARGVHVWRRSDWHLLPWDDVAAIGVGYTQPPRMPTLSLERYLASKLLDDLKIARWRNISLDIFPVDPAAIDRHPPLARLCKEEEPIQGLASQRWRVPLPPLARVAHQIGRGVEAFQPRRWLGWFQRP